MSLVRPSRRLWPEASTRLAIGYSRSKPKLAPAIQFFQATIEMQFLFEIEDVTSAAEVVCSCRAYRMRSEGT